VGFQGPAAGGLTSPNTLGRTTDGSDTDDDGNDFGSLTSGSFGARNNVGTPAAANTLTYPSSGIYIPRRLKLDFALGEDSSGGATDTAWFVRTGGAADDFSPHLYLLSDLGADLSTTTVQQPLLSGATTNDLDGHPLVDGAIYKLIFNSDTGAGRATAIERTGLTFDASISTVSVEDVSVERPNEGTRTAFFKLTVRSESPASANALEMVRVKVKLMDDALNPLTTVQAQNVLNALLVAADTLGNDTTGQYHSGIDISTVVYLDASNFNLDASGVQVIDVTDPNLAVAQTAAGGSRIYYLVADWASDASSQTPNTVRMEIDTDLDITMRDELADVAQELSAVATVTTSSSTAIAPAQPPAGTTYPRDLGGEAAAMEGGFDFSDSAFFMGTNDGRLVALNADGTVKWSFNTSPAGAVRTPPINGCSICDGTDDMFYFANDQGDIYRVRDDGTEGTEIWKRDLTGVFRSAPIVRGATIYIGSNDGRVYKLKSEDGLDAAGWSFDPSITGAFSGTLYIDETPGVDAMWIGSEGGGMYRLQTADGTVTTSTQPTTSAIRTSPNLDAGAANSENNTYMLYWGGDDGVLRARDSGNLATSSPTWSDFVTSPVAPIRSNPFINRNESPKAIYFGSDNGKLYKINAETGGLIWEYQTGGAVRTLPLAIPDSFSGAGADYVYFGSDDGYIYGLNMTDGSLRDGWPAYAGAPVRTDPIYESASNSITIGTMDGKVYRFVVGP